jgi:FkbM family methyltransferase
VRNLLRRILFAINGQRVQINHTAIKVHPRVAGYYSLIKNNPVEPELYNFLSRILKRGDVFVDIGANTGFISLLASDCVGDEGLVISFEPNPSISLLANHLLENNASHKNYIILQQAVSDKAGLMEFSISSDDSPLMERASLVYKESNHHEIRVLCHSLDEVLAGCIVPTVIKIDVEGAELQVLEGAKVLIAKHRPMLCIEVHGLYFDNVHDHVRSVFEYCEKSGYQPINLLKAERETFAGFMKNSGVTNADQAEKGYGNLIFVSDAEQADRVVDALRSLNRKS